ncbi:MAG TPA: large conductance mechanosensitive channel protein MscL [Pyrinomonadaceae bacterium]|jgi:large conductance mechanosensitive channel|nr:large conductance mechanosensitive channel protein MscL [Pyrinomonadaceae bacterium]
MRVGEARRFGRSTFEWETLVSVKGEPKMFKEFREFIARGNVVDLAVAVVIGAAFGKIVTTLVDGVIMPPIGLLTGRVNFTDKFYDLSGGGYRSLAEAKAAGAPAIAYGALTNDLITFLIIAFVVFLIVRAVNRLKSKQATDSGPTTRDCPYCLSTIPLKATRCAQCCAELQGA